MIEKTKHYVIVEFNGISYMYVSEDFVKKHGTSHSVGRYLSSDIAIKVRRNHTDYLISVFFVHMPKSNNMYSVGGLSGDFGFNWGYIKSEKHKLGKTYRMKVFNQLKDMINKEFPENKNTVV